MVIMNLQHQSYVFSKKAMPVTIAFYFGLLSHPEIAIHKSILMEKTSRKHAMKRTQKITQCLYKLFKKLNETSYSYRIHKEMALKIEQLLLIIKKFGNLIGKTKHHLLRQSRQNKDYGA
jgi:hypothetical protein